MACEQMIVKREQHPRYREDAMDFVSYLLEFGRELLCVDACVSHLVEALPQNLQLICVRAVYAVQNMIRKTDVIAVSPGIKYGTVVA